MSVKNKIHADVCSMGKEMGRNEDYAICVPEVGACVADGVGGAPLGDALARLACCVAMGALRTGSSAVEAVERAREHVAEFVQTVDLPRSGTSLAVIKFGESSLEAAWLGDVALIANTKQETDGFVISNLENYPGSHYLCRKSYETPQFMEISLNKLNGVVACTDGVWRRLGVPAIARMMEAPLSVREKAARLAMGEGLRDDSTALVLSVAQREEAAGNA